MKKKIRLVEANEGVKYAVMHVRGVGSKRNYTTTPTN